MILGNSAKILVTTVLLAVICGSAQAAGNIDTTNKYAWAANVGWVNFNPSNGGATVCADHLEGDVWAENIGWIRLGSSTNNCGAALTYTNTDDTNYGVNKTTAGVLSGYGWSTNAGWINFEPSGGGVTIDSSGNFGGYAWGENIGWIHFANTTPAYKVATAAATYPLTVGTAGTGSGTTTGAGSYASGTMVTLTATPASGSVFAGWSPSPCAARFEMPASALTCTATFELPAPTAAPSGLTATAISQTQINLSWTDKSANETGFRIFRNGTELTPSPKAGTNVTTFQDTNLICGTTYTYSVKATNANGDSASAQSANATTRACVIIQPDADMGGSYTLPANQAPVADILYVSAETNKPISVILSGRDPDTPNWFAQILKPLSFSVVTKPQHGSLSGTSPNLIYTPDSGYVGIDSFTYKASDGLADSPTTTVSIIVHQNSHVYVADNYGMTVFCAEYHGVKYGFGMSYAPLASDPSGYYWKMNLPTFGKAYSDTKGCIAVEDNLGIEVPYAYFQGKTYQFVLNHTPLSAYPSDFYWKMDLITLKSR